MKTTRMLLVCVAFLAYSTAGCKTTFKKEITAEVSTTVAEKGEKFEVQSQNGQITAKIQLKLTQ